jgi:hypothetical protein
VKHNQKRAVTHSLDLNRQLEDFGHPAKPPAQDTGKAQRFKTTQENTLTGKNRFHYACEIPSLLMIIELANDNCADIISLDKSFNLPSKSVPFVNLTSRKYTLKLEQEELLKHMNATSEEKPYTSDLEFSFHEAEIVEEKARPKPSIKIASIKSNSKNLIQMKQKLKPIQSNRPDQISLDIKSKQNFNLTRPLAIDSKGFLQLKPAIAVHRQISRITLRSQKTATVNSPSNKDDQEASWTNPSPSSKSGNLPLNPKVSLQFKLKLIGQQSSEKYLTQFKKVLSCDSSTQKY